LFISNPIQSNLYCENTADKMQWSNSVVKNENEKKSSYEKPVLKSVGVFILYNSLIIKFLAARCPFFSARVMLWRRFLRLCWEQWYFSFKIHFRFSFYKFFCQSFLFLYYISIYLNNYFSFYKFLYQSFLFYNISVLPEKIISLFSSFEFD